MKSRRGFGSRLPDVVKSMFGAARHEAHPYRGLASMADATTASRRMTPFEVAQFDFHGCHDIDGFFVSRREV